MNKHGHYCKICGDYKANEKFSGKGHANHICRKCATLSAEAKAEMETITKLSNLPFVLSKEQKKWLKNRTTDKRPTVRALAQEEYNMRFDAPVEFLFEEMAAFDVGMQEEFEAQRHLTTEEFVRINPEGKLLDFEIFKRANTGDEDAIASVIAYYERELGGYLPQTPDETDIQCHQDLIWALRQAIVKYKIRPDDTYYSYDEILDMAHKILNEEDAADIAALIDPEVFLS